MAIFRAYNEVVQGDPVLWEVICGHFETMNEMIPEDPMIRKYYVTGKGIPEGTTEITVTVKRKVSNDWTNDFIVTHEPTD